jgi:hypothetical protein
MAHQSTIPPAHIARERGGAPQSTIPVAAAPRPPLVKDRLRRPPPLPPGHQEVGSPPPSSPVCLYPLSAQAPRSQTELDLDAGRRLPVYVYLNPFSLLVSQLV